jgi:hypothetical protein
MFMGSSPSQFLSSFLPPQEKHGNHGKEKFYTRLWRDVFKKTKLCVRSLVDSALHLYVCASPEIDRTF